MRLATPRVTPLAQEQWTDEQREVLEPFAKQNRLYNIYSTLGHNPPALKAFLAWGGYVLRKSDLPSRDRELVILRVGFLCRAGYEWAQHSRLGRQAGLTDAELTRIKIPALSPEWSARDRLLLTATDELHRDHFVSDTTWLALREILTERQCMDLVYVIAHYTQVCMILNTFGIQLDSDLLPDEYFSPTADAQPKNQ
jgi:4-carboxymuconolactone decarboxylase